MKTTIFGNMTIMENCESKPTCPVQVLFTFHVVYKNIRKKSSKNWTRESYKICIEPDDFSSFCNELIKAEKTVRDFYSSKNDPIERLVLICVDIQGEST